MFRSPTVLILGAGASRPYGYPLGGELLQSITSGIDVAIKELQTYSTSNIDFFSTPYSALVRAARNSPPHFFDDDTDYLPRVLHELRSDLSDSHRTIDELARIHPRWRKLLKLLVAIEIGRATYQRDKDHSDLAILNQKLIRPASNGWYSLLIHELRNGARNADDLAANELSIITFNYDRSLEWHFERELGRGEIFSGFDMLSAPPIAHVHGKIELNFESNFSRLLAAKFWNTVCDAVDRFVMIDEDEPKEQNVSRNVAREHLAKADRIFVLGCDLHEQNTKLLKLDRPNVAKHCVVLNWNGTQRVRQRALEMGIKSENILSGSEAQPMEILAAIEDGGLFSIRP